MEDTRPRTTLKNDDKECAVVLDRVGLLIQPDGGPCWCLSWEKLEELKEAAPRRTPLESQLSPPYKIPGGAYTIRYSHKA